MTSQQPHFLLISAATEGEAWVKAALRADATIGEVTITRAASQDELEDALSSGGAAKAAPFSLVLADLSFDGMQAREIVERVHAELPAVPVVLLAGPETLAAAVELSQDVTAPVVLKTPDSRSLLPGAVHAALRNQRGPGTTARSVAAPGQAHRHDFFTGSQVAMLLIDPATLDIRDANAAACDFYGYPREQFSTLNIAEMTLMPPPRALRDAFASSLGADGAPFVCRQRLASGEVRDVELFSSAIPLDGRTTLHTVVHDITERQLMQQALRRSEERFKRIAENAPDMIFRWSYAQGFEYVNPASTEVIGYTPEEHYQDPGLGYRSIHIDDLPIYESVFSDLADPEGPRRYCVIRWIHKAGHIVHVEMRMTPIFDEHGNLVAIEGIARDISQHVHQRERLRELTGRLTRAHEEERRRIARELHDEVGQALTIARMRTRMLHKSIPEDATDVRDRLGVLDELIQEMLRNVRALSHELRPPLLDEMGWRPAIEALCDSFSQRTGLPVTFRASGTGDTERLPPDVELVAYRVVQEALTNIARHAEASRASVSAHLIQDGLRLMIEDDGVGFDSDAITRVTGPDAGLGLLGMQERIDTVGGRVRVDSAPGRGTRIHAHLPREVML